MARKKYRLGILPGDIAPPPPRPPFKKEPPKRIPLGLGMEHPGLLKTPLSKPTLKSGEVRPPHKPGPPIPTWKGGALKRVKPLSELPLGPVKKRVKLLKEAPPEALAKLKRRGPKPLSELLPSRVVKKSAKPAPGRSPMLKWKVKKR